MTEPADPYMDVATSRPERKGNGCMIFRGPKAPVAECTHGKTEPHTWGEVVSKSDAHWLPRSCPGPEAK